MIKLKQQPVTQEDLQLVSKIEEQSFNRDFDKVVSLEELKESYDELSKSKGEVKFIVLDKDIVGYYRWIESDNGSAEITDVAVIPKFQKMGIGSQILELLTRELARYDYLKIVVHPKNIYAIRLYLEYGFIPTEISKNYYDDGEGMLIMKRAKS